MVKYIIKDKYENIISKAIPNYFYSLFADYVTSMKITISEMFKSFFIQKRNRGIIDWKIIDILTRKIIYPSRKIRKYKIRRRPKEIRMKEEMLQRKRVMTKEKNKQLK